MRALPRARDRSQDPGRPVAERWQAPDIARASCCQHAANVLPFGVHRGGQNTTTGGVTPAHPPTLPDQFQQLTDRLLDEGTQPLVAAAKAAGMRPVPCLRTLMRAAMSGKLEALKLQGRWCTSSAAVRRWITRNQPRAVATAATVGAVDPNPVLSRYGLAREANA